MAEEGDVQLCRLVRAASLKEIENRNSLLQIFCYHNPWKMMLFSQVANQLLAFLSLNAEVLLLYVFPVVICSGEVIQHWDRYVTARLKI